MFIFTVNLMNVQRMINIILNLSAFRHTIGVQKRKRNMRCIFKKDHFIFIRLKTNIKKFTDQERISVNIFRRLLTHLTVGNGQ